MQIALHMNRGDTTAAIDAATKYLDVFQSDVDVWRQLADLYLSMSQLEQAQFCLEECLLQAPGDVVTTVKLADILFAQGGAKILAAKGYYARAIESTKGESVRALYGILACTAKSEHATKAAAQSNSQDDELAAAAREQLQTLYARKAPGLQPCLQAALDAFQTST